MRHIFYKDLEGIIIADDNDDEHIGNAFSLVNQYIWIFPKNKSIQDLTATADTVNRTEFS